MQKTNFLSNNSDMKLSGRWVGIFLCILVLVSLYDLMSPPISPTIWRQTQTAMLTENFVKEGFSLKGLYLNLRGNQKLMMVYEMPIYNFLTGLFFLVFNSASYFWGKLVSLSAAIVTFLYFFKLVRKIFNTRLAFYACIFFVFAPIRIMMATSFQPDSLSLAFLLCALNSLFDWNKENKFISLTLFSFFLLLAGWTKFPIIIPYIPLIGFILFSGEGRVRLPKIREIMTLIFIFMIPFIAWYLYRGHISAPEEMSDKINMFLFGDLRRFINPNYYVKPLFVLGALVFCGGGAVFFFYGLKRMSMIELSLLIGIPFYFVVVPTVSRQYYYLFAALPIFALFMGRGFINFRDFCIKHSLFKFFYACIFLFICGFFISSFYVLRHDTITYSAAKSLNRRSAPSDLVFSLNMHDRGQGVGGENPAMLYLSDRKGWNAAQGSDYFDDILRQSRKCRASGAKWMVVTWYTAQLEPWFASVLPQNLRRDPNVPGRRIFEKLKKYYPVVDEGDNYAVMELNTIG